MLGFRAADNLNKHVGDTIAIDKVTYKIVGIFSVGNSFGDSASRISSSSARQRSTGHDVRRTSMRRSTSLSPISHRHWRV